MKRFIIPIIALFVLFLLCGVAKKENILVIESYHAEYLWDMSYKEGLHETLGDQYNIIYFEMDTKRLPQSAFQSKAELAWETYQKVNPSLVILGDDNALKHVGPKFIQTDTPVVYLGINNNPRNYGMVGHKNITGVLERPLPQRSILFINTFLKLKKVLILFDSGTTSQVISSEIFNAQESVFFSGIQADIKLIDSYINWQEAVLNSKKEGYDIIIAGLYHTIKDHTGSHVDAEKVLEWTSQNTPLPPFGFWDFSVGANKTIGGYVLFGKEHGITAGRIALEILSGKSPGDINPQIPEKGRFLFSQSQLKKWGVTLTDPIASTAKYTE